MSNEAIMDYSNSEISLYVDTIIIQSLLPNKTASIIDSIKNYIGNNINPDDKVGSVLNMLGPAVISTTLGSMGFGKIGFMLGLACRMLHVDFNSIIRSIHDKITSALSGDKKLTSSQIHNMVTSSVTEHVGSAPIEKKQFNQQLQDIRMMKLAETAYYQGNLLTIQKYAKGTAPVSYLSNTLSWLFRVALSAAGLVVAADVANKFLGRPSALDGTQNRKDPAQQLIISTQTKFKINPSYHAEGYNTGKSVWAESITNSQSSIENMVTQFAKEVYQGLNSLDNLIRSTSGFNKVVDDIVWYNKSSAGDDVVFIPKKFTSKKSIVDFFMDEVAQKVP